MLKFSTFQFLWLIFCQSQAKKVEFLILYKLLGCRCLLTQSPQCNSVEVTQCNYKLCVRLSMWLYWISTISRPINLNWFAVDWWQKNCHCWREEDGLNNMHKSSRHFNGQCLSDSCDIEDLVYAVWLSAATQACNILTTSSASDGQNSPACTYIKHGTKNSPH
jgi:hypothetical protein